MTRDDLIRMAREAAMADHITINRAVVEQALEALYCGEAPPNARQQAAADALRAALAQQAKPVEPPPEWELIKSIIDEYGLDAISFVAEWKAAQQAKPVQEPLPEPMWPCFGRERPYSDAYSESQMIDYGKRCRMTATPERKPLTEEEIDHAANNIFTDDPVQWWRQLARAIEAAHGINRGGCDESTRTD